jgi:hypothetical protein
MLSWPYISSLVRVMGVRCSARMLLQPSILLAATQATAIPSELAPRTSVNDCAESTFINQSSEGSPLIADCEILMEHISGSYPPSSRYWLDLISLARSGSHTYTYTEGKTWSIPGGSVHCKLAGFGTCAFGTESEYRHYVGNQDIIDLIKDSIARFAWNGRVGAKGVTYCQWLLPDHNEVHEEHRGTSWFLYAQ